MRIAIIGVGGVGALFGGRLSQAGEDVVFVARGEKLRALREKGLFVTSVDADIALPGINATDDIYSIGKVDAVVVCVKAEQLRDIAPTLRPLLHDESVVVPMQNGVEAADDLRSALPHRNVVAGLCRSIARQVALNRFEHSGVKAAVAFGSPGGDEPSSAELLRQAYERAGVIVERPDDLLQAIWEKFLFVEPFGTVGAAARAPMGTVLRLDETRRLLEQCAREVMTVAAACGVTLDDAAFARTWQRYESTPPSGTASMQRDLMEGRPSELEAQTGSIVRLARRHAIAVPVHEALYAVLQAWDVAARSELR